MPTLFIPAIEARVERVRFFETGREPVPRDHRVYRSRFDVGDTRYLAWELELDYPVLARATTVELDVVIERNGHVVRRHAWALSLQAGWSNSWHFWSMGSAEPGTIEPGSYTASFHADGRLVASADFTMSAPGGDAFPDDLGDL